MKQYVLLLIILFAGNCLLAQTSRDEKEIAAVLNRQTQSWNQGNLDVFMQDYWHSDSLIYVGKNGVIYGYANVLSNYKKNYADTSQMGKLFFEIVQVRKLSASYYWVFGKYFLKRSVGNAGGQYTLLFKKIKGRWMIVADHSSAS